MKKSVLATYNIESIHPGFSIDCVILGFHKGKLKILLNKFYINNYWALPGGFMFNYEDSDQAAYRILKLRTGLTDIYLKQFYLFSNPKRSILEHNLEATIKNKQKEAEWFLKRFITLAYYALVRFDNVTLQKVENETARWFDIDDLPERLYADHKNIIDTSLKMIRSTLPFAHISKELLPEKFTITELRKIYETITGKTVDRRNFQRKILSGGWVIQLEEKKEGRIYNAPILYTIDATKENPLDNLYL